MAGYLWYLVLGAGVFVALLLLVAWDLIPKYLEQRREDKRIRWLKVTEAEEAIPQLAKEKSQGFPWLAKAYADFFYLQDLKVAEYLEHKKHYALKAGGEVREMAVRRRAAEDAYRVLKYQLEYYENLFPWLVDFKGEDLDDLVRQAIERKEKGKAVAEEPDDPAKKWLPLAEYERLPTVKKFQMALDRYWSKPKSRWEIVTFPHT